MSVRVIIGDCREALQSLPSESVNCIVTSPPYFGLRDYGVDGQIGLEATPDAFVTELVAVFREVRRVLRDDGTLWLNLGDSYASGAKGSGGTGKSTLGQRKSPEGVLRSQNRQAMDVRALDCGLADKNLLGIPWRVAFALQADGWYLRQDIIWAKPNPMPESVTDRCTKAHEYVFLLSKSARYYYDQDAIAEPSAQPNRERADAFGGKSWKERQQHSEGAVFTGSETRNARSVWNIATQPFSEAHFATFPPELAERCIKAGCPQGGTVLDPFGGAGTTGLVADRFQRSAILIELNPAYADMARNRIKRDAGLFGEIA